MIDVASIQYKNNLAPYAKEILEGLIPILARLDVSQLSPNSFIAVENQKEGFVLRLEVIPSDENIPFLGLSAGPDHCILDYADSEVIEAFGIRSNWKPLVDDVLDDTERYLNGVTVIEKYNRNHKLIKKLYFFGINTENDRHAGIGTSIHFAFPRKIEYVEKRTHRFMKSAGM